MFTGILCQCRSCANKLLIYCFVFGLLFWFVTNFLNTLGRSMDDFQGCWFENNHLRERMLIYNKSDHTVYIKYIRVCTDTRLYRFWNSIFYQVLNKHHRETIVVLMNWNSQIPVHSYPKKKMYSVWGCWSINWN